MANPNKAVGAARQPRTLVCVDERPFGSDKAAADAYIDQRRKEGKHVRLIRFKLGPKRAPVMQYHVKTYERT